MTAQLLLLLLGSYITIKTPALAAPDDSLLNWMTTSSTTMVFSLRACSSARLLLSSRPTEVSDDPTESTYEVILGASNHVLTTARVIGQTANVSVLTPFVLSCDYFKQFWVDWSNNTLQLGHDQSFAHPFLELEPDFPFSVYGVAVQTLESKGGEWIFNRDTSLYYN